MRYIFLFCMLFVPTVHAYQLTEFKLLTDDVVSVYDGDTLTVNIPYLPDVFGDKLSIRVTGIDTPEMRSTCSTLIARDNEKALAIKARQVVVDMLTNGHRVTLSNLGRDKYFRLLATVSIDGVSVGDALIAKELAVAYSGDTKAGWCGL